MFAVRSLVPWFGSAPPSSGPPAVPCLANLRRTLLEAFGMMENNLNFAHSETTEADAKDLHNNQNSEAFCRSQSSWKCFSLRRRVERRSMNSRRAVHGTLPPGSPPLRASSKRKRFPVVSSAGRGPRRQPMRARLATPTNAADVEAMETALRSDFLDQAQPLGSGLTSVNQATSLIMAGSDAAASTAKGKVTRSAEVRHAGA
jgi:hypothetical protein